VRDHRGPFSDWAELDPTRTLPRLVPLVRRLPGAKALEETVVAPIERTVITTLARRLAAIAAPARLEAQIEDRLELPRQTTAAVTFKRLLDSSGNLTADEQREQTLAALVAQVVPDEARMLVVLATGEPAAVVHVVAPALPGTHGHVILGNVSNIGRRAGVPRQDQTSNHIARLTSLGLVEEGDELPQLSTDYEILLAGRAVRAARQAPSRRLAPRIRRASLRLTPLGRELVDSCLALDDGS
jgi:hypothetical protein